MNAVRILLLAALAAPFIALIPSGQDSAGAEDWGKHVDKACTSPRYGLRLAAAKKVAGGGGTAVPAIRAFAQKSGRDAIPQVLVDMIADDPGLDEAVIALLREWANDRDFFWRAHAMRGLALRVTKLPDAAKKQLHEFFVPYWDDSAWLMRTHARFGGAMVGDQNAQQLPEPDPRARAKEAILLLQHEQDLPDKAMLKLGNVIDALADERTFQGDPWGPRFAAEANKALKAWLGDQYPEITAGDTEASVRAIVAAASKKSGGNLKVPELKKDPATPFVGGIEILSCKYGDVFVQWTAAGEVHVGLEDPAVVRVPDEAWHKLDTARKGLEVPTTMGTIVCDAMRLRWSQPDVHAKAAPHSLPAPVAHWLRDLARALDGLEPRYGVNELRPGLEQFAPR